MNEVPILSLLVSAEECPLEKSSKSLLEHKVNILNFINKPTSSCAAPVEKIFSNSDWEGALSLWCFGAIPGKGEMLMEHTGLHPLGIQHVVECPALVPWLEKWGSSNGVEKEEAKQTIRDLFVDTVKVIFVPASTMHYAKVVKTKFEVLNFDKLILHQFSTKMSQIFNDGIKTTKFLKK